jgi:hypothetical protein
MMVLELFGEAPVIWLQVLQVCLVLATPVLAATLIAAAVCWRDEVHGSAPQYRRDSEVIDWVRAFRQRHGRSPSILEVQSQFATMSKASAWRYATAA